MAVTARYTVCLLLTLRLASVFLVSTSYVPDEYWQSLEVAHNLAFSYGHTTWEWRVGIRSYLYPGLIAILYKILSVFSLDSVTYLVILPRMFQALLSVISDVCFLRWCKEHITGTGCLPLLNISVAWFHAYTATRTLTNSVETSLTQIALYMYPWNRNSKQSAISSTKYLWIVGLACLIRPTACVIWLPFVIYQFMNTSDWKYVFLKYLEKLIIFICLSTVVDSFCHGALICSPINFIYYNIIQNIGSFYGTHGIFWYFTTGIPCVLGVHLIPFVLGCNLIISKSQAKARNVGLLLFSAIIWTSLVYSMIPHKEFRFILPLIPMMLFIATVWLTQYEKRIRLGQYRNILHLSLLFGGLVPFLYCGAIHQRGTLDVMNILAEESAKKPQNTSLWFLTPCHSTPLYSHLHQNVSVFFLECDPLANQDEADVFFHNPAHWLQNNFPEKDQKPSHIVLFRKLYDQIKQFLAGHNYKIFVELFHSHFPEGNAGTHIMILKKTE